MGLFWGSLKEIWGLVFKDNRSVSVAKGERVVRVGGMLGQGWGQSEGS